MAAKATLLMKSLPDDAVVAIKEVADHGTGNKYRVIVSESGNADACFPCGISGTGQPGSGTASNGRV